jgi:hypothetical protein
MIFDLKNLDLELGGVLGHQVQKTQTRLARNLVRCTTQIERALRAMVWAKADETGLLVSYATLNHNFCPLSVGLGLNLNVY